MSMKTFEEAIELSKTIEGYRDSGGVDDETIEKIEAIFGFKLSPQHLLYFRKYGDIEYPGKEFYGVYPGCIDGMYNANAVASTIRDRREHDLPKKLIPIYNYDFDMAYLDYDNLDEHGEPRVIAVCLYKEGYFIMDKLAKDLGDYLLLMAEDHCLYENGGPEYYKAQSELLYSKEAPEPEKYIPKDDL